MFLAFFAAAFDRNSNNKFHPDRQCKYANEYVFLGQVKCDILAKLFQ